MERGTVQQSANAKEIIANVKQFKEQRLGILKLRAECDKISTICRLDDESAIVIDSKIRLETLMLLTVNEFDKLESPNTPVGERMHIYRSNGANPLLGRHGPLSIPAEWVHMRVEQGIEKKKRKTLLGCLPADEKSSIDNVRAVDSVAVDTNELIEKTRKLLGQVRSNELLGSANPGPRSVLRGLDQEGLYNINMKATLGKT